jgi:hypothetical protein
MCPRLRLMRRCKSGARSIASGSLGLFPERRRVSDVLSCAVLLILP